MSSGVPPTSTSIRPILSTDEHRSDKDEEVEEKKEEEKSQFEARVGRRPAVHTKADIGEYDCLHLTDLSWCRHCFEPGEARSAYSRGGS